MNDIKDEAKSLGVFFIVSIAMLKILFYKEGLITIIKIVVSFFWVFILPGFILMWNWKEKLNITTRTIISIALSAALVGISSYYLGLLGLHIKYHKFLIPAVVMIIGSFILLNKKRDTNKQNKGNDY